MKIAFFLENVNDIVYNHFKVKKVWADFRRPGFGGIIMIRSILAVLYLLLYLVLGLPVLGLLHLYSKVSAKRAENLTGKIVRWGLSCITAISGAEVEVLGLENIPKDTAVLYIGNHRSIFDVIISYPYTVGRTGFIAKNNLEKVPILPIWMSRMHCLFLDRDNPRDGLRVVLQAIDYIKSGISVFVFPEGTRTKTGAMAPFKEGTFKMATKTGCPIIPVAFTNTDQLFERHFPFIKPAKVIVHFGKPIMPDDIQDKKHAGAQTQAVIQQMLIEDERLL